jgi:hypothetical protein
MKYDDAAYHIASADSEAHAAAHIGLYFRWCLVSGLVSEEHTAEPELADQLQNVRRGQLTGTEYLWENTSGKLADVDLSDEGNRFTKWFYDKYYLDELRSITRAPDYALTESDVDFQALRRQIDQSLTKWREKPPTPWWKFWG